MSTNLIPTGLEVLVVMKVQHDLGYLNPLIKTKPPFHILKEWE
jgi:hypothetical protein